MRKRVLCGVLLALLLPIITRAQRRPQRVWDTHGFQGFRRGEFGSSGANIYVSRKGTLQTVHRYDVNHDGYFDLIYSNTHDVSYIIPSYEYEFTRGRMNPIRREYVGIGSVRVRSADLNEDGHSDLVIARGFDDTSYVHNSWIYWGSAMGWTSLRHTELPTPYVRDFCIGNLNHDRFLDLVFIASSPYNYNTSLVYWGGSDGYSIRHRVGFQTPGANGCLITDVDGDGNADLIVTAGGSNSKIFWGVRQGIDLKRPSKLPVESALSAVRIGSRLAVTTSRGIEIIAVHGRDFNVDQNIPFVGAGRIAAADLNRDGVPDLVVTREASGDNWETISRIFWGKRHGSRVVFKESEHTDLPTLGAVDVAVADLDGDGYPDIVFANSRTDLSFDVPSYVYWGGPHGCSDLRRTSLPTHGAQAVSISGMDVFFANSVSGRTIGDIDSYVYLGDAHGSYSTTHLERLPTVGAYEACVADLNDDGYPDVLFANSHEGAGGNSTGSYIYWGGKDGLSASRRSEVPSRGAIGCAVADLNRDGYLDLFFSNLDDNTAQVLYGGPDGFSTTRQVSLTVKDPRYPLIADLNRDGYLDLLVPSVDAGLYIFWGSASGYGQMNSTLLPAVGAMGVQVADLNGDGYLDLVVPRQVDLSDRNYHLNSYIYWGSRHGFSVYRRTEVPSIGAEYATIADFNRDGFLDIFISNYQGEFSRDLDSYIYWGNARADYTKANRQALHVGSGSGAVAADLNADGWIDLAVSNHFHNGTHYANSLIFWNGPNGFDPRRVTLLPTIGAHMMTGVDEGNIYTRALREAYTSAPYDAGEPLEPFELDWEGKTPYQSRLGFELRGAESILALKNMPWKWLGFHTKSEETLPVDEFPARRWWQFRVVLAEGVASSPSLDRVLIKLARQ